MRSRLEELGITLQLFYNQFLSWKPAGGGFNSDSVFGHNGSYDLYTFVEVDELIGWPGLDFLAHVKGQYDHNVNSDVGALGDPIDDADFDEPIYLSEIWLQQALFEDRVRLRAGFFELQTLFDRNAYANSEDRQFLNTFLDNNAAVPLPSGLGGALILVPFDWLEVAIGAAASDNFPRKPGIDSIFEGIDEVRGYFEVQARTHLPGPERPLTGSYRAGFFVDGSKKTVFDTITPGPARTERGHLGAYANFDQLVYAEDREGPQGLGLFGRFGYADGDVNPIAWFWSAGLQYLGLLPCRDLDVLGVGVYQTIGSESFRDAVDPDFDLETGIELYYRIAALPWLTVTPDFQYIVNPGASGTDDAFVGTLRFRFTF